MYICWRERFGTCALTVFRVCNIVGTYVNLFTEKLRIIMYFSLIELLNNQQLYGEFEQLADI